ncbi:hypothetical protein BD289DRAFT_481249 [Coniella lustricola]|uniref:Essential protein Yae1 N-terminal domain-containing protein n=1 Tax=Coniella lustricola TaxID=2025994 RepID=A0A2T3ACW3_9PEZI|nr:hypothetical protein BD289DRAFT_481249 [Coniella lustricola]
MNADMVTSASLASSVTSGIVASTTQSDMCPMQLAADERPHTGNALVLVEAGAYRREIVRLLDVCQDLRRKKKLLYAAFKSQRADIARLCKELAERDRETPITVACDGQASLVNTESGLEEPLNEPIQGAGQEYDGSLSDTFSDGLSNVPDDIEAYDEAIRQEGWNDGFDEGHEVGFMDGHQAGFMVAMEEESEEAFNQGWDAGRRSRVLALTRGSCHIDDCHG